MFAIEIIMGQRRIKENKNTEPAPKHGGGKDNRPMRSPLQKKQAKQKSSKRRAHYNSRRNSEDADKQIGLHDLSERKRGKLAPIPETPKKLKVITLGGQNGIGEKNMVIYEYEDEAVIVDCGFSLGIDLPGVNYSINPMDYLEKIKHKIKAYVFTHGHLDHIGAIPYVMPKYPAPAYGSEFTVGMVEKQFNDFEYKLDFMPETKVLNMDNHERVIIGKHFTLELVRITHSVPESSCVVLDTPAGRVINTGDFRLDPEPLDNMPSDIKRLKELGDEGVALLMSESTGANYLGRTPTEHTLQATFDDIIPKAPGRIFVASFSSNINRIQMVIDAAVKAGRKVAFDGRSMLAHIELSVRLGIIKIPAGTIASMRDLSTLPDDRILAVVTGGQGELNASLQRMSVGEHKFFKLKKEDTIVISSNPIPGNMVRYQQIGDDVTRIGCKIYSSPNHEIDGCGPLHVSGHARRDEHREMIELTQPNYFVPIYAGPHYRKYHYELFTKEMGKPSKNAFMMENGDVLAMGEKDAKLIGKVSSGSVLVDQTAHIVPAVVVKDRLLIQENGFITIVLTLKKGTGELMSSPDIISRGFIYLKENEELVNEIRRTAKFLAMRQFKRMKLDDFKVALKEQVQSLVYDKTKRSPVVISVVNVVNANGRLHNLKPQHKKPRPKHKVDDGHARG